MAQSDAQVNWYEKDLMLLIEDASDELLTKLVFQGEGLAKVGATVDTGFMRNAIYGIGPQGSHRSAAESEAGSAASRDLADCPRLKKGEAAIHAAAQYTIYQEMQKPFIYPAVEKLAKIAGGTIQEVGKGHFD